MVILECSCLKMMIGRQFEKEREKLEQEMSTLDKSWKYLPESRKRNIRARKVHPERTVGTLYHLFLQVTRRVHIEQGSKRRGLGLTFPLSCARVPAHIYPKTSAHKKNVRTQDFRSENLFFLEVITFLRQKSRNQSQLFQLSTPRRECT